MTVGTATAASLPLDERRVDQPTGLAWALWTLAAALPWLLPTHLPPWPTFHPELLAAAVLLPIGAWALLRSRGAWSVDVLVAGFALAACIPLAQGLAGLYLFAGEALLATLYLTGFALTALVARHAEQAAPGRLIETLLAGLSLAALLSTGMALCQWLDVDVAGAFVAGIAPGSRPAANVGQPNNLATLLVWGMLAIWWGYAHRKLGAPVAMLAVAFLAVGVALTQSRTGLLAAAVLGVAGLLFARRTSGPSPSRWAVLGLMLWLAILVLSLDAVSARILEAGTRSLQDQVSVGKRPMIWRLALEAIAQRPWAGYGWNQGVPAHVALAERFPDLHVTVQHMHNLVLDLLLWNGVPIGLALVAGLALWFGRQLRGALSPDQRLLLLALGVFMLHAMLELPHTLAFFLLPVAVMMGTLAAWRPTPTLFRLPRLVVALLLLAHAGALVAMFDDYRRIESDTMAYRFRAANIGMLAKPPEPEVYMLGALQQAMTQLRHEPARGMPDAQRAQMREALLRYPAFGSLIRYARASALNGDLTEARWALETLCLLDSVAACQSAERHWRALIAEGYPELAQVEFPTAR